MMTPAQEMMKQMLMQQQQQLLQSPITQGTMQGMQAAKQSIQMDEQDKNRAMGLGMFNAGTHLTNQNLQPGQRPRDVFQLWSHALPHGVQAYLGEEDRAREMNAQLLARQMEQEDRRRHEQLKLAQMSYKMEREQAKEAEDKAYNKRYLDIMAGRAKKGEVTPEQKEKIMEGVEPGYVPLQLFGYNERNRLVADMLEMTKAGKPAMQMVKDLKKLDEILDKYPDLSTSMARAWAQGSKKENPSSYEISQLKLLEATNPGIITALNTSRKIISNLMKSEVKAFSGGTATDVFKHTIHESLPSIGNDYETNKYITGSLIPLAEDTVELARRGSKGLEKQWVPIRKIPELEGKKEAKKIQPALQASAEIEEPQALESGASIQQAIQDFPPLANAPEEQVREWIASGGYEKAKARLQSKGMQ